MSADKSLSEASRSNVEQPAELSRKKSKKGDQAPADLGRALKTVYDDTLREDVPNDFLDLLGKLN